MHVFILVFLAAILTLLLFFDGEEKTEEERCAPSETVYHLHSHVVRPWMNDVYLKPVGRLKNIVNGSIASTLIYTRSTSKL
jgi:hypothetical protein